jgi:hypothetical protein
MIQTISKFEASDVAIGNAIAAIASCVSIVGVFYNNVLLQHTVAMQIWVVSNLLFVAFFYGQYMKWWNGGLSSLTVCITYFIMLITGLYGLVLA